MLHTKNFFQGLLRRRSWRTNMARFMESGTSRCKAAMLQRYCNSVTTPITPLQHTQDAPRRDIKKIWNIFHQSTNHYVIFWWFSRIAKLLSLPPITTHKSKQLKIFLRILLMWKHILKAGFHWWQSWSRNSLRTGSLFSKRKKKTPGEGSFPAQTKGLFTGWSHESVHDLLKIKNRVASGVISAMESESEESEHFHFFQLRLHSVTYIPLIN